MHLYVEVWNARPAWLALSIQDRISYLDRMERDMQALLRTGATLVGVALTESARSVSDGARYVAVWVMPEGGAQVQLLDAILDAAGWEDYFERDADRTPTLESKTLFEYVSEMEGLDPRSAVRRN
jgi:hypothetical protein